MDQPRFAPGARRLAGLACRAFGWTPDTFWNATPAELAAILATDETDAAPPLGRDELAQLMERDANG
jgi:uncharacterized phage protein (TIGR02216 family)